MTISAALVIVLLVDNQYRTSSGITSMTATRGSCWSPLWTPSLRSPNHAEVLERYQSNYDLSARCVNVQVAPMLRNEILVLANLRDAAVGCPVRRRFVVERHIDVRVVFNFLKLVRRAVRDEDERYLAG